MDTSEASHGAPAVVWSLGVADPQAGVQLGPLLLDLAVEIAANTGG